MQQQRLARWAADVDAGDRTVASYLEAAKHLFRHRTPVVQILVDQVSLLDMKAHVGISHCIKMTKEHFELSSGIFKIRAAQSDSKQELESIGIDHFGRR